MLNVLVVLFHVGFAPHGRFALDPKGRSLVTSLCGASQLLLDMSLSEVHVPLTHMAAAPLWYPPFSAVCSPTLTVRISIASTMLDVNLTELPVIPAAQQRKERELPRQRLFGRSDVLSMSRDACGRSPAVEHAAVDPAPGPKDAHRVADCAHSL